MVKALSPIRILRARRTSFQATEETQEIDFQLGLQQGVQLYAVEFGIREAVVVPTTSPITAQAHLSLHVEIGALEGAIDEFPTDNVILNSEIVAETTLQITAGDTAQVEGTFSHIWTQPLAWNYLQLMGEPLLLAQNVTFRGITSESALTVNGAQVTILYRYVELSKSELGEQFTLRR